MPMNTTMKSSEWRNTFPLLPIPKAGCIGVSANLSITSLMKSGNWKNRPYINLLMEAKFQGIILILKSGSLNFWTNYADYFTNIKQQGYEYGNQHHGKNRNIVPPQIRFGLLPKQGQKCRYVRGAFRYG